MKKKIVILRKGSPKYNARKKRIEDRKKSEKEWAEFLVGSDFDLVKFRNRKI